MSDITTQQKMIKAIKEPDNRYWMLGIGLLSVRLIQGFVYWAGGARRFIYGIHKIDPDTSHWMAHKFQSAMPGAIMGFEYLVSFIVQHFWILYPAIILFSAAEFIVGLFLMIGLFTRAAAFISMIFSILLMFLFGWQGATCIDEWTMAACNLAMGTTLFLCGSHTYSVDNVLLRKNPQRGNCGWFRWISGALPIPLGSSGYKKLALWLLLFVAVFDISTYSHYRGSVVTPFHSGPVSPTTHHLTLTNGIIDPQGYVSFHAYLDAGTAEAPAFIMDAWLVNAEGEKIAHWNTAQLTALPKLQWQSEKKGFMTVRMLKAKTTKAGFTNDYNYNVFEPAKYGFKGEVGAKATITLPPTEMDNIAAQKTPLSIELQDADGHIFKTELTRSTQEVQP